MIEYLQLHVIYENPLPMLRSRHAYFPGVAQLSSGDLIALFALGEAFESVDLTTYVARSCDSGATWRLEKPVCDKSLDPFPTSDFLKPQILRDGHLIALGYRFDRLDPNQPLAIKETDGVLPGDDIVSFSHDDGRTWSRPLVVPRSTPELIEIASRPLQLHSGDVVATGGLFKLPDGTNPSGQFGVLLRSRDSGQSWDDSARFFVGPSQTVAAYESNICELQPGRLVAICWALDISSGKRYPNQVTVSHDNGHTWSTPIDTGHMAESANLLYLGGELLLSVHCHRGNDVGLVVRLIDFSDDRWHVLEEKLIWGNSLPQQVVDGQKFHESAWALRFGQASLLKLNNGDILVTHWAILDGQGKILSHRLRLH